MGKHGLTQPAADHWQVLIQSFSSASLQKIHAINPSLPLIQLFDSTETSATIGASLDATQTYAVGIGPSKTDVDSSLVATAHGRCLDIHPYTVNDKQEMRDLISLGVDGMFTNFPNRLDKVLGSKAADAMVAAQQSAEAYRACRVQLGG